MIFCVYARIKISSNELYGVLIQSGSFICICASLIFKIKLDKKPFLKLNTWPNIGRFYFYFFYVNLKIKRPEKMQFLVYVLLSFRFKG